MKDSFIDINLDQDLISLFIHKPFNFKRDTISELEIQNQFKKIEKAINYNFNNILRPHQTHSNNVQIVNENNINDSFDNVDGLITNLKGVALCTQVADCQSILLYDFKNKVIGNVHSGWRGTLTRICTNAIEIMKKEYHSDTKNIKVYISPSIHKCHFEVGEELKEEFVKEFNDINIEDFITKGDYKDEQKYYIDTVELNKMILLNLGLKEENIIISDICSVCDDRIHSYRKDKPNDGRNVTLICMK